jgi:hypothetical protein
VSRASVLCATVLVVSSVAAPLVAAAATPRPASRHVELVIARPVEETPRFEAALRDVLMAKGLGLVSARKDTITPEDVALATTASPDEAARTVARVFVDFAAPGHATLFLIDPKRGRIHVRRVMLDHGFDAVAREGALFVIEQSIDAILEGREIGVTREEYQRSVAAPAPASAPEPAPPPAVPTPPPAPVPPPANGARLLVAGGYEAMAMGSGEYQHAARVVAGARFARVQIAVAARAAVPLSIAGDGVQARLWAAGIGLSGAARLLGFAKLSVSAGLGGGFDLTRVEPTVTAPDLQAATAFWALGPSLRTFVELERLFGDVSVAVVVGAEAHLLAERYTVRTGSAARDVFVPRRLRPDAAVLIGVVF